MDRGPLRLRRPRLVFILGSRSLVLRGACGLLAGSPRGARTPRWLAMPLCRGLLNAGEKPRLAGRQDYSYAMASAVGAPRPLRWPWPAGGGSTPLGAPGWLGWVALTPPRAVAPALVGTRRLVNYVRHSMLTEQQEPAP